MHALQACLRLRTAHGVRACRQYLRMRRSLQRCVPCLKPWPLIRKLTSAHTAGCPRSPWTISCWGLQRM